jgi:hypothetical protein
MHAARYCGNRSATGLCEQIGHADAGGLFQAARARRAKGRPMARYYPNLHIYVYISMIDLLRNRGAKYQKN